MKIKYSIALISITFISGCSNNIPILGANDGNFVTCPETPNCVNSQINLHEENYVEPLVYSGTITDAHKRMLEIIGKESGATIVNVDNHYIQAEYRSSFFQFVDDIEFYLVQEQVDKVTIHVRSASRVGRSDFGVNRDRVERIRRLLVE